jgi:ketosteroid isomerase-like protein
MTDQQADIQAVLDAYAAAVYARDVDAFVALYDDDVHFFDAWNHFETRGIDGSGDVAFAHAAVTFAGESATGERLRAMTNRFTFCLAKRDGAWKIVHEHSSLPIDYESMKAIFAR